MLQSFPHIVHEVRIEKIMSLASIYYWEDCTDEERERRVWVEDKTPIPNDDDKSGEAEEKAFQEKVRKDSETL